MKRRSILAVITAGVLVGCGASPPRHRPVDRDATESDDASGPFAANTAFKPRSFVAKVSGHGRPVIFIPGLGCPGEMWDATVEHLGDRVAAHVLTLAGFAGVPPIKGALAANVRKELVRYIRARHLVAPILVGHSMGGTIAYWVAATAPEVIGGVIVVDAGPALADTDTLTANTLRNIWAQAGDDELPEQVRAAYTSMATDPKTIEPYIATIARSDRQTMGNAIYELVTTDLRDRIAAITAPMLLVLADGGYQQRYKADVAAIHDHQVVVLPHTRHFVMFDDPVGFGRAIDGFLAAHPAK